MVFTKQNVLERKSYQKVEKNIGEVIKTMKTEYKAIIEAFENLQGERSIKEIEQYIQNKYGNEWKDIGTVMADMVAEELGGNKSSTIPKEFQRLIRTDRGIYKLR